MLKRLAKYLILAVCPTAYLSGCSYPADYWKVYGPLIKEDINLTFGTGRKDMSEESSRLMKMIEKESLKPVKNKF